MKKGILYTWGILALLSISYLPTFAQTTRSVLAEGDWFKVAIEEKGIYKIDATFLKNAGFDLSALDPRNLQVYGNGGGMLAQANEVSRLDDLQELSILVQGEEDGRFDDSDYLLFYAEGPDQWTFDEESAQFEHEKNLYDDQNFYFIHWGERLGKRLEASENLSSPSFSVDYFDDYQAHERDEVSILGSGRNWYGEIFSFQNQYDFNFNIPGLLDNSSLYIDLSVIARSTQNSSFSLQVSGQNIGEANINSVTNQTYDFKGRSALKSFELSTNTLNSLNEVDLSLNYQSNASGSIGHLDYLRLNFKRNLSLYGNYTFFRNIESRNHSVIEYTLSNLPSEAKVWDISQPGNIKELPLEREGSISTFRAAGEEIREFVVFETDNLPSPQALASVPNQNLHGMTVPNLVIITPPEFRSEAQRLADFRQSNDGISVAVVSTEEVYNEFSSGKTDLSALRDFLGLLYMKNPEELRYLLLFGDASYDYKDRVPNNTNLVPIYESRQSLHPIFSYSSDDYFGFLEEEEGKWEETSLGDHTLDIGIGRLPVQNLSQARQVVDKLMYYSTQRSTLGAWRNQLVFVADDGDNNTHQRDADRLAEQLEGRYKDLEINKLYVDAFEQVSTGNGERVPNLSAQIEEKVEEGTLILNFTGHGGEVGWTDERILESTQIDNWRNLDNLPFLITATCEFGRYDDPRQVSGGEKALLNPEGAAIGLITTTRPVFSSTNYILNRELYEIAFETVDGEMPRLGDIIRKTKNNSLNGSINRNFSLLGDPSLRLAYPEQEVNITHINGVGVGEEAPTLRALDEILVEGEIQTLAKERLSDFSGQLEIKIFDKRAEELTLGKAAPVMSYQVRENVLYQGKASIENGRFSFNFRVPKDINYQLGNGKMLFYAQRTDASQDANGGYDNILIGESSLNNPQDQKAPEIGLWLNDLSFEEGQTVGENALLIAHLSDESGINLSRAGIGHEITLTLDDDPNSLQILNEYYVADLDSYQSAKIFFELNNLSPGKHSLLLKAWDNFNNVGEARLEFVVDGELDLPIENFKVFPNPVRDELRWSFDRSFAQEELELEIELYDIQGNLIQELTSTISSGEQNIEVYWNGRDLQGNQPQNGVYIYHFYVRNKNGSSSVKRSGRVLIIH